MLHLTTTESLDGAAKALGSSPPPFAFAVCGLAASYRHLTLEPRHVTCCGCLSLRQPGASTVRASSDNSDPIRLGVSEAAGVIGVSRATLYRRLALVEQNRPSLLPTHSGNGMKRARWSWPSPDDAREWWSATAPRRGSKPAKVGGRTRRSHRPRRQVESDVVDWGAVAKGEGE